MPALRERIRGLATPLFLLATVALYIAFIVAGNAVASTVLNRLFRFMYSERNAMLMSQSGPALRPRDLGPHGVRVPGPRPDRSQRVRQPADRPLPPADPRGAHLPVPRRRPARPASPTATETAPRRPISARSSTPWRSRCRAPAARSTITSAIWRWSPGPWSGACATPPACAASSISPTRLAADADSWRSRFGQVPEFRAALHCGPVVTAEIGLRTPQDRVFRRRREHHGAARGPVEDPECPCPRLGRSPRPDRPAARRPHRRGSRCPRPARARGAPGPGRDPLPGRHGPADAARSGQSEAAPKRGTRGSTTAMQRSPSVQMPTPATGADHASWPQASRCRKPADPVRVRGDRSGPSTCSTARPARSPSRLAPPTVMAPPPA